MSLLIGIPCTTSVVIGADSAATLGGMLQNTIQQTGEKVGIVGGQAIFGVAGAAAISQQYVGALEDALAKETAEGRRFVDLPKHRLAGCLQGHFLNATELTHLSIQRAKEIVGNQAAVMAHLVRALIALPCEGRPMLFRSDEFCAIERIDPPNFEAIGLGQKHADPFLAFLKRVLWNNETPDPELGELSVVWALQHAIEVNTGGVANPKVLYTLRVIDGDPQIEKLDDRKIEGYQDRIRDIEERMRNEAQLPRPGSSPPMGPEQEGELIELDDRQSLKDSA